MRFVGSTNFESLLISVRLKQEDAVDNQPEYENWKSLEASFCTCMSL